jgi:O-antigen ligase
MGSMVHSGKTALNNYISLSDRGFFSYLAAVSVMVMLPLHPRYLPPFLILWVLFWIFENYGRFSQIVSSPVNIRVLFFAFISYYLFQVIGLIYSDDLQMGLSNAFGRLSLVFFPLVLFYPGEMIRNRIDTLLKIFSLSTFCFLLFCFIYAAIRSISLTSGSFVFNPHPDEFPYLSYFYASDLTLFQHPSYLSMYVLLSAFICFETSFGVNNSRRRSTWFILALLLVISLYFISSRTGILIAILLLPYYFFRKVKKLKKSKFLFIGILVIMILSLPLLLKNQRVEYLYDKIMNNETYGTEVEEPRFIIWKSAMTIFKNNPFLGVGIGDVRTELAKEYERAGKTDMAVSKPNAHNQFIEVLLETGIIGFIMFISLIFIMFRIAILDDNLLYGVFIMIILAFFIFETILYRLAGVSFFSLFAFLLYWYKQRRIN